MSSHNADRLVENRLNGGPILVALESEALFEVLQCLLILLLLAAQILYQETMALLKFQRQVEARASSFRELFLASLQHELCLPKYSPLLLADQTHLESADGYVFLCRASTCCRLSPQFLTYFLSSQDRRSEK